MLTVSLDCLRLVSCVANVDSVSGLYTRRRQTKQKNTTPKTTKKSKHKDKIMRCQNTRRRQSRDTVNIRYTRHKTKTFSFFVVFVVVFFCFVCLRLVSCVPNVDSVS
jgi:hypothetical protein